MPPPMLAKPDQIMPKPAPSQSYADDQIRLWITHPVASIELNQPERKNAMSKAMWAALPDVIEAIEADNAIRVVLLKGAGETFCAGADISEFASVYADKEQATEYNRLVREGQFRLRHMRRPTIAVINGACVGGGCGLALACDLRFAADEARFAITPARLGLAYSFADTAQLVEKIGPARAKDMLFSGRFLDAPDALSIGLIDRVVNRQSLVAAAESYAESLSVMSLTSILAAKTMINFISEAKTSTEMEALAASAFDGPDFTEGYKSFLEKRKPVFR